MDPAVAHTIENFFAAYGVRQYDKGQILVFAHEDPQYISYLLKGQVRQYDVTPHGDEVVLNIFKPPAFFPMSWAINRTPNDYFFQAATAVEIRQAPPDAVVAFIKQHPEVMFDLLSRVYRGTDGMLSRMAHLMGSSARNRLLFELALQCNRFGELRTDGSYFIPISEGELGARAGLSRETVSREMQSLRHLITANRQGITIAAIDQLRQLLESE